MIPLHQATGVLQKVLTNLHTASTSTGVPIDIVLRSDSTLRGYFPLENNLATTIFGPYDAWILAPSFFEGGRVTLGDVHYALDAHDQKSLIPVGDTPSAQDKGFGYRSSNMKEWVLEKFDATVTKGCVNVQPEVLTIGVDVLRRADAVERVAQILKEIKDRSKGNVPPVIVPNTFSFDDMAAVVAGCNLVPDMRLLYRTGASFVSARLNIERRPPIGPSELFGTSKPESGSRRVGGLIIIGSYVPRTTAQREYLVEHCKDHVEHFELDVEGLLVSKDENKALIQKTAEDVSKVLQSGVDAVVSTSRRLITSENPGESLRMGSIVNDVLVNVTREITTRPKYVIAKVRK